MGRVSFGRCCDGGRLCRPFPASDTGSCHRGQGSPAGGSGSPAEIGEISTGRDTAMDLQADYTKHVYVAEKGTEHTSVEATIRSTYTQIGTIPAAAAGNNADWWVGDVAVDMETGAWYPAVEGSGESQGMGDRCYAGGSTATSGMREWLQGGSLRSGSFAGSACLNCWHGLSSAWWPCLACD